MWTGRSVLLMGIATAPPRRANRSRWTTSAPERRPLVPTHLGRFHQPVASESQTRRGRTPRWARQGSHPLPAGHRFRCPTPSQPATSGPRRRRRRTRPTIVRRRPSSCHSCRWPPGKQATLHLRGAGTRALRRCHSRVLYSALCRLRFDSRACTVQRLPGRLVTTPQTVQSFMDQLALLGRVPVLTLVTLVTLDCSPSTSAWVPWPAGAGSNRAQGILRPHQRLKKPLRRVASPLRSVKPVRAAVYSPTVLRPRDHARAPCSASPLWLRS